MLTMLLAFAAAVCFALGAVLQQRVAMGYPDRVAHGAWFIVHLAAHPIWLAGLAFMAIGFALHAGALASGELVVVEPILSLTLVLALPFGVVLSAQRPLTREILASVAVAVALAVFLVLSNPAAGIRDPATGAWAVAGAICLGAGALLTATGLHRRAAVKAALVGTAAGVLFGLHTALTKGVVDQLDDGIAAPFGSWELYALIVLSWIGLTLAQISLQAGDLAPAISTQSILAPVVALALGLILFEETIHDTAAGTALSVAALVAMFAGLAVLAGRQAPASSATARAGPP